MTTPTKTGSSIRARDLGIPFDGEPGPLNAITDVAGVEVGFTTLIEGDGPLEIGAGPVRTGVTIIHPRGQEHSFEAVWAGRFSLNGNGEMTGVHWIDEAGAFSGPVAITNTHSVGIAHHAILRWLVRHSGFNPAANLWMLPVAAETCDEYLNDINGQHVTEQHVLAACDNASTGAVAEGNIGGGTGMICYEFKGGTGTASRRCSINGETFTTGVLVQANFGSRPDLSIRGVPVGRHLTEHTMWKTRSHPHAQGSIIAIAITDAPLMPIQLQRIAKRIGLGVARTGSPSENGSGDILLAMSTSNEVSDSGNQVDPMLRYVPNHKLDPLFLATVEATEEAIINALVGAETMTGQGGHRAHALDHAALQDIMKNYGR
jgi:D-aminopeptidase